MINLWPFLLLAAPAWVTLRGSAVAWVWASLGIGVGVLVLLYYGALSAISLMTVEPASASLFAGNIFLSSQAGEDRFLSGPTGALAIGVIALAIAALLLAVRRHPDRAPFDLALFWISALIATTLLFVPHMTTTTDTGSRAADAATSGLSIVLLACLAIAVLRPLTSLFGSRKPA
ncbi:hypothetical protein [Pseudooctadecabacter sp.]|uniref:hypothetical protein n=1 Tax=Pseudooctadecabacter sp. TaxID=1966338 RepID=UPI0025ED8B0B|nr:hypothetical protein [Pseudooctadecabacter sp.]